MRKPTRIEVATIATVLVRETGYNAACLKASGDIGETYSRAKYLYDKACELLRLVDMQAEEFIAATYNPDNGGPTI